MQQFSEKFNGFIKNVKTTDSELAGEVAEKAIKSKPNQVHHFATNKSKKYTKRFEKIANKYKLDLDDSWNKELMPHQGRHPYAYHDYIKDYWKNK